MGEKKFKEDRAWSRNVMIGETRKPPKLKSKGYEKFEERNREKIDEEVIYKKNE